MSSGFKVYTLAELDVLREELDVYPERASLHAPRLMANVAWLLGMVEGFAARDREGGNRGEKVRKDWRDEARDEGNDS